MTKEEIRLQVALSCIQGVLEAKHGFLGEIVPSVAVAESLRIANEFVRQWFHETETEKIKEDWRPTEQHLKCLEETIAALTSEGKTEAANTLNELCNKVKNLL